MVSLAEEITSVRINAAEYVNNVLAEADKKDSATVAAVAELLSAYKSLVDM